MVVDALVAVNPYFNFTENLTRPEEYMKYTDGLVKHIEVAKRAEFKEAQGILRRIHKRDLYKCAGEILVDHQKMRQMLEVRVEDIVSCHDGDGSLRPDDVILHRF